MHRLDPHQGAAHICRVGASVRLARQLPGVHYQAAKEDRQATARNTRESLFEHEFAQRNQLEERSNSSWDFKPFFFY